MSARTREHRGGSGKRRIVTPDELPLRARRRLGWRRNLPIIRFVALFLCLLTAFQLVYYEFVTQSAAFAAYLTVSARAAGAMLRLLGETVTVSGDSMYSTFAMSIKQGCDGLQAAAILAIGVLIFPGRFRDKILGVTLGVGLLVLLNVVRIATLFWAGLHARDSFQTLHVHVWPAALVFSALTFWTTWMLWTTRPRTVV
jgi:exosortase/archaeosortase family protein